MRVMEKGLLPLIKEMKGPLFRDVNRELRSEALDIALGLQPHVVKAVAKSLAPQAEKMSFTVRAHRDRIPVVVVGKTNPKLMKFSRRGPRKDGKPRADIKVRRIELAYGVTYGPLGGRKATSANENYYKIPRDQSGGALGDAMRPGGKLHMEASETYMDALNYVLTRHGFIGSKHEWNGRG